jgi:two-component system invasion response regulator UvrY
MNDSRDRSVNLADPIKIMIVDDHCLIRKGIRRLLDDVVDMEVIAEAESGEEAIKLVREKFPDVLLLDVKMPGIGGLETARRLVRVYPKIRIIALSALQQAPFPSRVLQIGAAAYLTKEAGMQELLTAIRKVHGGERYISKDIATQIALQSLGDSPDAVSPLDVLSERELQVMLMITTGLRVQDISAKLCLSSKTVNSYRYRLFEKLNIKNDVELTLLAMQHGLIDKPTAMEEEAQSE